MIVREVFFDLTWLFGSISVATYLASVLRTIPLSVYTSYIILVSAIVITCALFTGYLRQQQDITSDQQNIINALTVIHFTTYSISCFIIVAGFVIYGKKLVNIANEGLRLLEGVNGYPTTPRSPKPYRFSLATRRGSSYSHLELRHDQMKRALLKMRIVNAAFTLSFIILGLIIGVFAFYHQAIFEDLIVSKIISILDNWMPMLLNVSVMAGIAYGEMKIPDRTDPTFSNLVLTETSQQGNANVTNTENGHSTESIETTSIITSHSRTSFHQRNESTGSDTPLICNPSLSSINASPSESNSQYGGKSSKSPTSIKWPTIISPIHMSSKQSIQYGKRNSIKDLSRDSSAGVNPETNNTSYINIGLLPTQPISLKFPSTNEEIVNMSEDIISMSEEIVDEESTDDFVIESSEIK
ncbi:14771_t:CDS:2 [Cetraspora pellucida]|uniref:14771_t:CDS:1 n=1 Tax=Cetraspora pellucida TaxID=1433469 RepID=A0A9N9G5I4_9GLOM|nr:14771_t:CDS:2 [Cetraspora pellucida]